jgi:hypothetical protein
MGFYIGMKQNFPTIFLKNWSKIGPKLKITFFDEKNIFFNVNFFL